MSKHAKVMLAPSRYVQGRDAIEQIGRHVSLMGKKALVIGGKTGRNPCP
ncbi:MAG: hypothetical protein U9N81_01150 [Bacillota bacterium]|nr:hypothetical protein [Bacillota bacterium]